MNNIWDEDKLYSFLRRYVDLCARRSFRRVEVVGQLPDLSDGAWLFIANHTHTLMDALVILQLRHEPTAFGARADVFRNPTAAKFRKSPKVSHATVNRRIVKLKITGMNNHSNRRLD